MIIEKDINGKPYPYYSQRNNVLNPNASCNVTSMIQALRILGCKFPVGDYKQPEDNLYDFIKSKGKNPTVHKDLSSCTNEWIASTNNIKTKFSTKTSIDDIKADIDKGIPVVLSGTFYGFPIKRAEPMGHIVTLVGYDSDSFYINDPFGNTLENWGGKKNGKMVKLTKEQFMEWFKPCDNESVKWAHRFFIK